MSRSDLQAVFLYLKGGDNDTQKGFTLLGEFDSFSGGGWSIDGTKYYPPGQIFPVNDGGKAEVEDGEITRKWIKGRDDALYALLNNLANAEMRVTRHIRNPDLSVVLKPFAIFNGLLAGLAPPEYDGQSTDTAMLSLTVSASGPIA